MKATRFAHWTTLAASALLLAGCQSARLAVPADLESRAEVFPCIGRSGLKLSERFSFGPYEVIHVRRGWTRRHAWSIGPYEHSAAGQQLEFTLQAPSGQAWQGQAATGVRQKDLTGLSLGGGDLTWGLAQNIHYLVRISPPDGDSIWSLALAEGARDTTLNGTFSDGRQSYRVEGSHQLAGTPMPLLDTAGFLIFDDRQLVAAVDLLNAGSVHFDRRIEPERRDALAAAATALLLYRDISKR